MIQWITSQRCGPIGVDVGSRCVKLVQFNQQQDRVVEASRWDWSSAPDEDPNARHERLVQAIRNACEGRSFRGRRAVLCLSDEQLFLQNVRVQRQDSIPLERVIAQEITSRLPYPVEEAEIRFWEVADIRQGQNVLREVIVFAVHCPVLTSTIRAIADAGLRPVAVDVEPAALLRSYSVQFRRDDERGRRTLLLHIGYRSTIALIAQNEDPLFVKYIDIGGRHFDEAVSRSLALELPQANALRRSLEDTRDAEVEQSIAGACRPIWDRLVRELSMCVRYHSVTFRGKPLDCVLVGGGEGSAQLMEVLQDRLGIRCEASDPFRRLNVHREGGRPGQWDVAAGLALRRLG